VGGPVADLFKRSAGVWAARPAALALEVDSGPRGTIRIDRLWTRA
jgi:hypothetical protein